MSRKDRILHELEQALSPSELELIDDSHKHKGHRGTHQNGESHYQLYIKSADFDGLSLVQCHRKVNALLKEEFNTGLHALQIHIKR